ncbi:hypothetical protein DLAC_03027 [Tieghemostelium lacteum]|uniref:PH domain-containing protein n=1 Tax=Tieghemostelium lacteum TaxID=361077 RepID=A0A152A3W4_TIELA|nr:hypothetical protein DLAC_03027 [Tieghemostelium lacteum]|eukprot:KYR00963.1 hypothetical protein DLAC_03027 [Tieghemostelium lacteum]
MPDDDINICVTSGIVRFSFYIKYKEKIKTFILHFDFHSKTIDICKRGKSIKQIKFINILEPISNDKVDCYMTLRTNEPKSYEIYTTSNLERLELLYYLNLIVQSPLNATCNVSNVLMYTTFLQKKGKLKWSTRFMEVYNNQILLYKNHQGSSNKYPTNVISLSELSMKIIMKNILMLRSKSRVFYFKLKEGERDQLYSKLLSIGIQNNLNTDNKSISSKRSPNSRRKSYTLNSISSISLHFNPSDFQTLHKLFQQEGIELKQIHLNNSLHSSDQNNIKDTLEIENYFSSQLKKNRANRSKRLMSRKSVQELIKKYNSMQINNNYTNQESDDEFDKLNHQQQQQQTNLMDTKLNSITNSTFEISTTLAVDENDLQNPYENDDDLDEEYDEDEEEDYDEEEEEEGEVEEEHDNIQDNLIVYSNNNDNESLFQPSSLEEDNQVCNNDNSDNRKSISDITNNNNTNNYYNNYDSLIERIDNLNSSCDIILKYLKDYKCNIHIDTINRIKNILDSDCTSCQYSNSSTNSLTSDYSSNSLTYSSDSSLIDTSNSSDFFTLSSSSSLSLSSSQNSDINETQSATNINDNIQIIIEQKDTDMEEDNDEEEQSNNNKRFTLSPKPPPSRKAIIISPIPTSPILLSSTTTSSQTSNSSHNERIKSLQQHEQQYHVDFRRYSRDLIPPHMTKLIS